MHFHHQTNRPNRAPPRPERNPLREQHRLQRLSLYHSDKTNDTNHSRSSFLAHIATYASTMLPPCNIVIPGSNKSSSSSGLRPNTPHMGPEPALPGVFHLDQDTISGAGPCPQHNHLAAIAHFPCLEASLNSAMLPSNLDAHAGPLSDTDGSQSSVPLVTGEESSGFMPATPCIAQGPIAVPATCNSPIRKIRKRPASPDLRADYLRSAILCVRSSGGNTDTNLPMKSALKAGLGLGITLDSEAGSSDALFDDSATITPMTITISAHMMDRFNNESDRTVVPATPGKRAAAASRTFFSVSSSPMSPPVIVVSHTESQAMQDTVISPKVATKTKTKSKSKSKSKSRKTKTMKQDKEITESKSMQGYAAVASPPPLAPQLAMTRSGYSRHH
ncbi:hypothetical protein BJ165DRAFT_568627 [Panaeolus papilionaceus]|nr:hypothetical protein BJ165DRAFT_568627 [Panaeolus papilionaceus]